MYDPLGLSIGTMNLVAATNESSPVIRRAVLTLYPHCAPKLGALCQNSNLVEPGTLMSAFVERIGDSVALISPDGSAHDPDLLTVEALDAMVIAAEADASSSEIAIAVPAHWKPATVQALRNALRTHVGFVRSGMAPRLVPDAIAALTAVKEEATVPADGVVGLLDFGASGTNVTLLEMKSDIEPVSPTMRYDNFSGNHIDQALLLHVMDELGHEDDDSSGTAVLGQLTRLSEQCREAKERLSTDGFTELAVEISGSTAGIELSRQKFDDLISDRLTGFIYAFDDMLARNKSSFADLAAVVTVGGGASIPLVAQRLSFHTKLPIFTSSQPVSAAAKGALLLAARGDGFDMRTRTSIGLMAQAAKAVAGTSVIDAPARDVLVIDHDALTDRELAWSQTEFPEVLTRSSVPETYNDDGACFSMRLNVIDRPKEPPWRRIRVSQVLIGLCAAVAMTAIGGVAITLTAVEQRHTNHHAPVVPSVAPITSSPAAKLPSAIPTSPVEASPLPPPPSEAPPPSVEAPPSVEPPPPAPSPPPAPPPVMTTRPPAPVTTTVRPPANTTPTRTPTTTQPESPAAESPPPETPATDPSSVKMTTQWVKVPLIPIPIPIQVPANQAPANQVPQNQVPQNRVPQNQLPQNPGAQNPFLTPGSP